MTRRVFVSRCYLFRTRNKGRSPVTDRPNLVSDRPNFTMAGQIERPLFFLTTQNNSWSDIELRYINRSINRYIYKLLMIESPKSCSLAVEFVVIASSNYMNFVLLVSGYTHNDRLEMQYYSQCNLIREESYHTHS